MKNAIASMCSLITVCAGTSLALGVTPPELPFPETGPWTESTITPDTRPVAYINTWNGDDSNDLRLANWWYDNDLAAPPVAPVDVLDATGAPGSNSIPDVFDDLIRRMDDCYDRGFRRIVMILPAGNPRDADLMASSQWWTMPLWRRQAFETVLGDWIDGKSAGEEPDPVDVGVYAGYLVRDPYDFYLGNYDPADPKYPGPLDTTNATVMSKFLHNIDPWIDVGVTEYWLDTAASAANWPNAITLQQSPDYDGLIRFGGEAIPSTQTGDPCPAPGWETSNASLDYMPWSSLFFFAETRLRDEVVSVNHEVHVRLTGHAVDPAHSTNCTSLTVPYVWQIEDAIHYYDNGWVLDGQQGYSNYVNQQEYIDSDHQHLREDTDYDTPGHGGISISLEAIQRIYGFGPITAVADFDGNGLIEVDTLSSTDFAKFYASYLANQGTPGPHTYIEGDVNGDGLIDFLDISLFTNAVNQWLSPSNIVVPVDLGDPVWVP